MKKVLFLGFLFILICTVVSVQASSISIFVKEDVQPSTRILEETNTYEICSDDEVYLSGECVPKIDECETNIPFAQSNCVNDSILVDVANPFNTTSNNIPQLICVEDEEYIGGECVPKHECMFYQEWIDDKCVSVRHTISPSNPTSDLIVNYHGEVDNGLNAYFSNFRFYPYMSNSICYTIHFDPIESENQIYYNTQIYDVTENRLLGDSLILNQNVHGILEVCRDDFDLNHEYRLSFGYTRYTNYNSYYWDYVDHVTFQIPSVENRYHIETIGTIVSNDIYNERHRSVIYEDPLHRISEMHMVLVNPSNMTVIWRINMNVEDHRNSENQIVYDDIYFNGLAPYTRYLLVVECDYFDGYDYFDDAHILEGYFTTDRVPYMEESFHDLYAVFNNWTITDDEVIIDVDTENKEQLINPYTKKPYEIYASLVVNDESYYTFKLDPNQDQIVLNRSMILENTRLIIHTNYDLYQTSSIWLSQQGIKIDEPEPTGSIVGSTNQYSFQFEIDPRDTILTSYTIKIMSVDRSVTYGTFYGSTQLSGTIELDDSFTNWDGYLVVLNYRGIVYGSSVTEGEVAYSKR